MAGTGTRDRGLVSWTVPPGMRGHFAASVSQVVSAKNPLPAFLA